MKQKILIGLTIFLSNLIKEGAYGTTQFSFSCPEKFIATVTNVSDIPSTAFPKVEIDFQIIQSLKGDVGTNKKIQIVKNGPVEFKSGSTYTVELRDSFLCKAEVFSKI